MGRNLKIQTCASCSKEFSKTFKTKFCSKKCFYDNRKIRVKKSSVTNVCMWCKNEFSISFFKRSKKCCSRSCASSYSMSIVDKETFGELISKSRVEGINSGRIVITGHLHSDKTKKFLSEKAIMRFSTPENNGMFGKKHSEESREKMSTTRSKNMIAGLYKRGTSGREYFSKAGQEIFYRSSWERKMFDILENDVNVISFVYEPFRIPYYRVEGYRKNLRNYVPDCLVTYNDYRKVLIEVKPKCHVDAEINLSKFAAAREYCIKNGMTFEIWTQDNLGL